MKSLEEKNKKYQSQLQHLKVVKNAQLKEIIKADPKMGATNTSLPPIKSEEDKQKLREELEKEYFD